MASVFSDIIEAPVARPEIKMTGNKIKIGRHYPFPDLSCKISKYLFVTKAVPAEGKLKGLTVDPDHKIRDPDVFIEAI